jgi:predicted DNA-binding transcriptional regulator AlpA
MRRAQRAHGRGKSDELSEIPQRYHLDRRATELINLAPGRDGDDLLSTRQVAAWLGVSEQWLEIARHKGYGPKFMRLSPRRIRYRRDEVLNFLQQRTHARTSEYLERAGA